MKPFNNLLPNAKIWKQYYYYNSLIRKWLSWNQNPQLNEADIIHLSASWQLTDSGSGWCQGISSYGRIINQLTAGTVDSVSCLCGEATLKTKCCWPLFKLKKNKNSLAPGRCNSVFNNPLCAKFFRGNINIYLHFMLFLHVNMTRVVEILPQVRQGPTYST